MDVQLVPYDLRASKKFLELLKKSIGDTCSYWPHFFILNINMPFFSTSFELCYDSFGKNIYTPWVAGTIPRSTFSVSLSAFIRMEKRELN